MCITSCAAENVLTASPSIILHMLYIRVYRGSERGQSSSHLATSDRLLLEEMNPSSPQPKLEKKQQWYLSLGLENCYVLYPNSKGKCNVTFFFQTFLLAQHKSEWAKDVNNSHSILLLYSRWPRPFIPFLQLAHTSSMTDRAPFKNYFNSLPQLSNKPNTYKRKPNASSPGHLEQS